MPRNNQIISRKKLHNIILDFHLSYLIAKKLLL